MNVDTPGSTIPIEPAGIGEGPSGQVNLQSSSSDGAAASRQKLDRALVGGLAWTASGRWLSQIFRWGATLATARLLLPSDYGIVGMATVITGLLQYVAEFGFGAAIIQQRSLTDDEVREIGGAALIISTGLALLTVLLAPLGAAFFRQPALLMVLPVLSIRFLVDSIAVVPRSVLARDLKFRQLTMCEAAESITMAALTVTLAWITRSYWSLILGVLGGGLVLAVTVFRAAPLAPRIPRSYQSVRSHLRFGSNVVLARLSWYTYSNADFVIAGRLMSESILGLYTLAWNVASVPGEKFAGLVLKVAPSVLSAARERPGEMRRYYLLLVRGVSLVTFPMAVGLSLVAAPMVAGLFGEKWLGAIGSLRFLALFVGVRSVAALAPVVMVTNGEPEADRNFSILYLLVLPGMFLLGSRWGITGIAATWMVGYPVLYLAFGQRWVLNRLEISWSELLAAVWPALSSCILMSLPVLAIDRVLVALPAVPRLVVMSMVGGLAYFVALRLLHRVAFDAAWQLVKNRGMAPPK